MIPSIPFALVFVGEHTVWPTANQTGIGEFMLQINLNVEMPNLKKVLVIYNFSECTAHSLIQRL
ncbi:hypothetical protein P279_00650 [Rhodobacteraceae bacterium PD-2]|nr:hypothetical protein P279_00650 [Rhodobacteraceae bacterium PD-2]